MSTNLRLTADEYDRMIANGAFVGIHRRIELIHGELKEVTPAGPAHEDLVDWLNRWSTSVTAASECVVRVQSSVDLGDSRPEPDLAWLKPARYGRRRPRAEDVLLLIEVASSSVEGNLNEKRDLYAEARIAEYWVVVLQQQCIHVFSDSDGSVFRHSQVVKSPARLAPTFKPAAMLDLEELFDFA